MNSTCIELTDFLILINESVFFYKKDSVQKIKDAWNNLTLNDSVFERLKERLNKFLDGINSDDDADTITTKYYRYYDGIGDVMEKLPPEFVTYFTLKILEHLCESSDERYIFSGSDLMYCGYLIADKDVYEDVKEFCGYVLEYYYNEPEKSSDDFIHGREVLDPAFAKLKIKMEEALKKYQ